MNPIIIIPARLGSVRLPQKPLADIEGKPMIVRVWEQAIKAQAGPVVVACDHPLIQKTIETAGGKAVLTDPDLPSGSDRTWAGLLTADPQETFDTVILLQGDLPLINPDHIRVALDPLTRPEVHIGTLAAEITQEEDKINPNVVKIALARQSENNSARCYQALYFSRSLIPSGSGPHYHHIGLYTYRRNALAQFVSLKPSSLEHQERLEQLRAMEAGMRIDVRLVNEIPSSVDTPEDLEKVRKQAFSL